MISDMVEGNDINFQISNIKKRIKVVEDYLKNNPNDFSAELELGNLESRLEELLLQKQLGM